MAEPRILRLQSPANAEPVFYKWPLNLTNGRDESQEIIDTLRWVCEDFPELTYAVENVILKDYDKTDFESMNNLCLRYNKALKNILLLWKGRAPPPKLFKPPCRDLVKHIINLCFNHAIRDPEKLNIYEPFSPEVYGETSFEMVAQILDEVAHKKDDIFIDLGSGVGQVVLQVAASNSFSECFGVEKADTPAKYAEAMENEFIKWMNWFGKTYTPFTLAKGDFLEDSWGEKINEAGLVFVNNFAFGPKVDHQLKMRFQSMKEGSKVISSKEYCSKHFKFNSRNLSELGAMMKVSEIKPRSQEASVSWTNNSVSFYLHEVDRTRLEKYFSVVKKRKNGIPIDEDEMSLYSESVNSVASTGTPVSAETLEDNLDDLYLGTTTRRQWKVLVSTIKQSKAEVSTSASSASSNASASSRQRANVLQKPKGVARRSIAAPMKWSKVELKNKILKKYGHRLGDKLKARLPSHHATSASSESDESSNLSESEDEIIDVVNCTKREKQMRIYKKLLSTSDDEADDIKQDLKELREKSDLMSGLRRQVKKSKHLKYLKESKSAKSVMSAEGRERSKDAKIRLKASKVHRLNTDLDEEAIEKDVTKFLAGMKSKYMQFIRLANTKEYADRLKVTIEYESAKQKMLERQIGEAERQVQALISSGLKNFSKRLVELDMAVKTPKDLLAKSATLTEKHQNLESKVLNMEVEIVALEEKYQNLCSTRGVCLEQDNGNVHGDRGCLLANLETPSKVEVAGKLCSSILATLNQRRLMLDEQSTLEEQIGILEKISSSRVKLVQEEKDALVVPSSEEAYANEEGESSADIIDRGIHVPKPRPVALVTPRMLSSEKGITLSPVTSLVESSFGAPIATLQSSSETNRPEPSSGPCSRRRKRRKHTDSPSTESSASGTAKIDSEIGDVSDPPVLAEVRDFSDASVNCVRSSAMSLYRAHEMVAPIVFPHTNKDGQLVFSDPSTKEFLRTSSQLLSGPSAGPKSPFGPHWPPVTSDSSASKVVTEAAGGSSERGFPTVGQKLEAKSSGDVHSHSTTSQAVDFVTHPRKRFLLSASGPTGNAMCTTSRPTVSCEYSSTPSTPSSISASRSSAECDLKEHFQRSLGPRAHEPSQFLDLVHASARRSFPPVQYLHGMSDQRQAGLNMLHARSATEPATHSLHLVRDMLAREPSVDSHQPPKSKTRTKRKKVVKEGPYEGDSKAALPDLSGRSVSFDRLSYSSGAISGCVPQNVASSMAVPQVLSHALTASSALDIRFPTYPSQLLTAFPSKLDVGTSTPLIPSFKGINVSKSSTLNQNVFEPCLEQKGSPDYAADRVLGVSSKSKPSHQSGMMGVRQDSCSEPLTAPSASSGQASVIAFSFAKHQSTPSIDPLKNVLQPSACLRPASDEGAKPLYCPNMAKLLRAADARFAIHTPHSGEATLPAFPSTASVLCKPPSEAEPVQPPKQFMQSPIYVSAILDSRQAGPAQVRSAALDERGSVLQPLQITSQVRSSEELRRPATIPGGLPLARSSISSVFTPGALQQMAAYFKHAGGDVVKLAPTPEASRSQQGLCAVDVLPSTSVAIASPAQETKDRSDGPNVSTGWSIAAVSLAASVVNILPLSATAGTLRPYFSGVITAPKGPVHERDLSRAHPLPHKSGELSAMKFVRPPLVQYESSGLAHYAVRAELSKDPSVVRHPVHGFLLSARPPNSDDLRGSSFTIRRSESPHLSSAGASNPAPPASFVSRPPISNSPRLVFMALPNESPVHPPGAVHEIRLALRPAAGGAVDSGPSSSAAGGQESLSSPTYPPESKPRKSN